MREILFKAKRIDNGEWVEGYLYIRKDGVAEINYYNKEWDCERYAHEVDAKTICQYTGLTDKNGKKIWENDIVEKHFYTDYDACANSKEYTGVVEFDDCAWVIKTCRDNLVCVRPVFESMAYSKDVEHFEVIGNVFDNAELVWEE